MSNIKEPYEISVWEEELIPAYSEYYKGENFTGELLTEKEFKDPKYRENWIESKGNPGNYYYIYGDGTTTIPESELPTESNASYGYEKVIMEHYEETTGIIIGAHDMDSPYAAANPIFKENVNGSVELGFTLYYKVFDSDTGEYENNPFVTLLANERKIKLHYRNKWYDLIVKNRVEDSSNYTFNYTCKDLYINELNKNGFKVELDSELENNQGTVTELAETILSETDWEVAPTEPLDKKKIIEGKIYSDPIIETKIEPLYIGTLGQDIRAKLLIKYTPDELANMKDQPEEEHIIPAGHKILFFYSDIIDNNPHPQILCRWGKQIKDGDTILMNPEFTPMNPELRPVDKKWEEWDRDGYLTDVNEDIIINAYNYEVLTEVKYADGEFKDNIPNILNGNGIYVYEYARGEKVVKSQKSGYDPDLDRFIFKFYKKQPGGDIDTSLEYYGYAKTDILRTDLAQNYLANSDNFTSTIAGWVFDGVPAKKTKKKQASYTGQIYNVCDPRNFASPTKPIYNENLLELNLRASSNAEYYPDTQGTHYLIKENGQQKYVSIDSEAGAAYEKNLEALFYKYKRNGVEGYIDKTDAEIDDMVKENLYNSRYSLGARFAINTGVAANRDKIERLTSGEEYLFAASLGKYKEYKNNPEDNETPPVYGENSPEILYGASMPDKLYEFIKVDDNYTFIYNAGLTAAEELRRDFAKDKYVYYLKYPAYKQIYDATYKATMKLRQEKYEQTYLKRFGLIDNLTSKETKERWHPGGRDKRLNGDSSGFYEILLNVFRGHGTDEEICIDDSFLNTLHTSLASISTGNSSSVPEQLYKILLGNNKDGLYPTMIDKAIAYSKLRRGTVFFNKSQYDTMGHNKDTYPEYSEDFYGLQPFMNSFNEWLFTEIYYNILDQWFGGSVGSPSWNYKKEEEYKKTLSTILKATYKSCYESCNGLFERYEYAKEYKVPTAFNQEGGTFYRMHKQQWEFEADKLAKQAIDAAEGEAGLFDQIEFSEIPNTEPVEWKITDPTGIQQLKFLIGKENNGEIEEGLAHYCYQKEKQYLSIFSNEDIQSSDFYNNLENARLGWINEYINSNNSASFRANPVGKYYISQFLPLFYEYWTEEKEIGTYTYAQDEYQLADNEEAGGDVYVSSDFWLPKIDEKKENGELSWERGHFTTHTGDATHYAYRDPEGGYVFDRNRKTIRLFDPYTDILNATFIPVKDDEGDYVYDVFHQHYRPYRNWDSEVRKDPITLEDDENGVLGDNVHHPTKAFDGHLFDWYDIPTRYYMKRYYEDPEDPKYQYLTRNINVIETGHYTDESGNRQYVTYTNHYPVGYQVDVYVKDDKGRYILASEEKKKRISIFKRGNLFNLKIFDEDGREKAEVPQILDKNKSSSGLRGFFERLFEPVKNLFDKNDNAYKEIDEALKNNEDADKDNVGLSIKNTDNTTNYIEDETSIKVYKTTGEGYNTETNAVDGISGLGALKISLGANEKELQEIEDDGFISIYDSDQSAKETVTAVEYVKYKWYYWRHWGKQRYDYQPKICIQQTINGVRTYKPYNNVTDKTSISFSIGEYQDGDEPNNVEFMLYNRKRSYRQKKETDYEAVKYVMEKKDKSVRLNNNYWLEAPNGENYLRRYKRGDGEIELFDGYFGKWIQCYEAKKVAATFAEWDPKNEPNYLPDFYMPYEDIMIPYDERIYDAAVSMTRKTAKYDKNREDDLFVLHNGIYIPYKDYFEDNGFKKKISYKGLKVSFIDNYEYDASRFVIKDIPEDRTKYLQFDLNNEPQYLDLIVNENTRTGEIIKERWYYWKASVSNGFALNEDKLSSLGMLFEVDDSWNGGVGNYIFLGMQMFKYIPYTKLEDDLSVEDSNISTEQELQEAYQKVFVAVDGDTIPVITPEDLNKKLQSHIYLKEMLSGQLLQEGKTLIEPEKDQIITAGAFKIKKVIGTPVTIPLFPGEAPDAKDLYFTNYYIYDPELSNYEDDTIYEYVGRDFTESFAPSYDDSCQSIRSIKGKESNYFKLLQDCCDTFDCWIEPIIERDPNSGKVKYIEKKVYVEQLSKENGGNEPQIFVGEKAKEKGIDITTKKLYNRLREKIACEQDENAITHVVGQTYKPREGIELDEKEQKDLLRLNRLSSMTFRVQYIIVPDKKIRFKRYVGAENMNGFKYGVNLKHIKRTIDSNQISTRIIVKANKNEHGTDGFCTIQRATENPTKENFLLDFSYYTQQGLLKNSELINDLYIGSNSKLNYYNKLARLNKDNDEIIKRISSLQISLDNINAKYETAVLARDAAREEITKLSQTLANNYDSNGQLMLVPWEFNRSQEYEEKRQTSAPSGTAIIKDTYGEVAYEFEIHIPTTATVVEYPKYNDTVRSQLDQMDTYQLDYEFNLEQIRKLKPEKERIEADIAELVALSEEIVNKKNELNKLFYHKYSRFIQEGSWINENYIDDNLYYLDALSVARTSSRPKITYDIGVADLSAAVEFEEDKLVLENRLGDRTYIEDTEFFGYQKDGETPYQEQVVVSEKIYHLENPSQNQIKVKNYTTQFDDLFQRIAATSQTLQFNEGSFNRAAALVNSNGTISTDLLQNSLMSSDFILSVSTSENVIWDNSGITVTSDTSASNVLKIVSRGILVSSDGGNSWKTAITGDGINADLLKAGRIDTKMLLIGNSNNPNFFWNEYGISAFSIDQDEKIDYSTFVRLDQYGIYGIQNHNNGENKYQLSFNDSFMPKSIKDITRNPDVVFGLTWDGFFLNASNGIGRVTIGTEQDFKMSEYSVAENQWKDRVIIGRLDDVNGEQYYGFRLKNENNEIVMDTNDRGELYLKNKLRISNFNDSEAYSPYEYIEEADGNGNIVGYYCEYTTGTIKGAVPNEDYTGNIKIYYNKDWAEVKREPANNWRNLISKPQDRVTLGIVDTYLRNYIQKDADDKPVKDENNNPILKRFQKTDVKGNYSSATYLTKVMSIKANEFCGSEPFDDDGEEINRLIEENETFAIFDNGNLYAKNAWVEGHIRAMSGDILGTLTIGKDGSPLGKIEHATGQWSINGDGTAIFKDVVIKGTIQQAEFTYNEIQSMSGTILFQSCIKVSSVNYNKGNNKTRIYLDLTYIPSGIEKVGENFKSDLYLLTECFTPVYKSDTGKIFEDIYLFEDEEIGLIYFELNDDLTSENYKYVSFQTEGKTSIVINANSYNSLYPQDSISIIETEGNIDRVKALFGKLNPSIFDQNNELTRNLVNSYGLYCENVYLKGVMLSSFENYEAGIDTSGTFTFSLPNQEQLHNAIFFSKQGDTVNFAVSREGIMYVKNGFFSGTISTAEIIGTGDGAYALKMRGQNSNSAFLFYDIEEDKEIDYFALNTNGAHFFHEQGKGLFSIVKEGENGPGLGMFFYDGINAQNIEEYLLNFKQTFKEGTSNPNVTLCFKGEDIATIDEEGFHMKKSGNGLEGCKSISVTNNSGAKIGTNFLLVL